MKTKEQVHPKILQIKTVGFDATPSLRRAVVDVVIVFSFVVIVAIVAIVLIEEDLDEDVESVIGEQPEQVD